MQPMNQVKRIGRYYGNLDTEVKHLTLDLEKCPVCGELILMK
ncbi:hypothetical protein ACINKY_21030 [Paenibacillus illinoisensis]|uniref:Transposase n=1 Tax=Paenibacillus illinoisensis TaxID=59845 RepID=A0ABW8HYC0_9BACL